MADQEISLKPGQKIKPYVSNAVASALVQRLYNLEICSIKELNSYDDRNFQITVKDDSVLPDKNDACPHGYILKVLNSLDSKVPSLIDAQNEMMLFLSGQHGIPCPRPVKNINGSTMSLEKLKVEIDDKTWQENNDAENPPTGHYIVRLLTFVPGTILFSVPYTKELFYQVGELAAKTDLALMEFKHSGLDGVSRIWNLNEVPKLREFVFAVQDEERRKLATEVIDKFQSDVVPFYDRLAHGPIHGDFNEQNILVMPNGSGGHSVSGLIDFGDIQHNYYVFEIAITICYMMIECQTMDILDAPGHVLAGYESLRHIPDVEFNLLKNCIAGRFCQSLVLGAYSYSQNPDPYLLTTSKRGWQCLATLWNSQDEELRQRWRNIIAAYSKSDETTQ